MSEEQMQNRLNELKKSVSDPSVEKLLEKMVVLEADMEVLESVPRYRVNPKNPTQVRIEPAFFAYQKTLGAYKEIVKLVLKAAGGADTETSPLREYLKSQKRCPERLNE